MRCLTRPPGSSNRRERVGIAALRRNTGNGAAGDRRARDREFAVARSCLDTRRRRPASQRDCAWESVSIEAAPCVIACGGVPKDGKSGRSEPACLFGGPSACSAGLIHTSWGAAESLRADPPPFAAVTAIHDRGPARAPGQSLDSVPGGLHGCFGFRRSGAKGGAIDHNGFADTRSATIPCAAARARIGARRNSVLFSSNCLNR